MDNYVDADRFAPLSEAERASAIVLNGAAAAHDDGTLVSPIPTDAPDPPMAHPALGKPTGRWAYRDAGSALLFWVLRFDPPERRKEFFPLTLWCEEGRLQWRWRGVPSPRPLYALDKLVARADVPVVVCEGEKSADAAATVFPNCVTTCSPNGSEAAKKADWSALTGRQVLIWPDADESGDGYASEVMHILDKIGCDISIIDAKSLATHCPQGGLREPTDGWDAADAVEEWTDLKALGKAALAHAKPINPGSAFISYDAFTMTAEGLTVTVKEGKGDKTVTKEIRVSSAFEIIGASRDPVGHGWGKWLRWGDADGRIHMRHVADAALHGDPSAVCGMLADEGMWISRAQQRQLVIYLSEVDVEERVTHVDRTGWHDIDKDRVFVLPDDAIGPRGCDRVILDACASGPYEMRGTLEEWQAGIGAVARGHVLPVLGISAAFAGPLLYLAGQEGGGINIVGPSSMGKSAILQAAASVWGRGAMGDYVRAWRATANGLEGVAASATDTALVLDELGLVEPRDLAAGLYSLSNGAGKSRAARDGSLRNPRNWRVLFISSGEVGIETKLAEERGRKTRAGQHVRMLDIPADRGLGFGVFDHSGPTGGAATLAQSFKRLAITAYGTAGPTFVRRLIDEGADEVGATVREMNETFVARNVPQGSDGQIIRAAERLGLIAAAGELAADLKVTPWESGEATAAAAWALKQWIMLRGGTEAAEVRQGVDQVRLFIEQHGEARFELVDCPNERPVINRAGWRKGNGPDREWWVLPQVWKSEICSGLDAKMVARVLADKGMLRPANDGFQSVVKIAGKPTRVYLLKAEIIEGGSNAG